MTSRAEAIREAGRVFARARATRDALPPRAAAERACGPYGPSLDEIENKIRAQRGLPPIHHEGSVAA